MGVLERISQFLNRILVWMGGVFLVAMVILTCADVVLRIVWVPIRGSVELVALFGSIVTAFALGYTQMRRGHVSVDVLITLFSKKTKRVLNIINGTICMIFFAIAAWRITIWATVLWKTGELTETLRIIYYPFAYGVGLACAVLSLVFLTDLLKALFPEKEDEK